MTDKTIQAMIADEVSGRLQDQLTAIRQEQTAQASKLTSLGVMLEQLAVQTEQVHISVTTLERVANLISPHMGMVHEALEAIMQRLDALTPSEPTEPEPEEPVNEGVFLAYQLLNNSGGEWLNGVSIQTGRIMVESKNETREAFAVGNFISFADGILRQITGRTEAYGKLFVAYSGARVDPAFGYPNDVHAWDVIYDGIHEPGSPDPVPAEPEPEEPTPEPEPEPEPTELSEPSLSSLPMRGANFAGLGNNPQFNPSTSPSKLGTHYRTSAKRSNQPDYFAMYAKNLDPEVNKFLVRMPFSLERLFTVGNGVLQIVESYALEMEEMITEAHKYGGMTLLDMHNYCRVYQPTLFTVDGSLLYPKLKRVRSTVNNATADAQWFPIGHPGCWYDYEMLAAAWKWVAARFGSVPGVWGYGLMNEPHNRGAEDDGINVDESWMDNVQHLVDAIRSIDGVTWITIGGCGYSTAKNWRKESDRLRHVTGSRIMFEAHQYPDQNGGGGGTWRRSIAHTIDPEARVADWFDVANWCAEVGRPLLAGEFGGPVLFEKWTADNGGTKEREYEVPGAWEYFEQLYNFFAAAGILSTQWLAGHGDSDTYGNGMDRNDGTLKGNATELMKRIGGTTDQYRPPRMDLYRP